METEPDFTVSENIVPTFVSTVAPRMERMPKGHTPPTYLQASLDLMP